MLAVRPLNSRILQLSVGPRPSFSATGKPRFRHAVLFLPLGHAAGNPAHLGRHSTWYSICVTGPLRGLGHFAPHDSTENSLDRSVARLAWHTARSQGRQENGTPKACETRM
jgi:hypothetical protein